MAAQVREHDWSATALGPIDDWPAALKAGTLFVLDLAFPAVLVWGPQLVAIHNDRFLPMLRGKADALGRSFADIWAETWPAFEPIARSAFAGEATYREDFPFVIGRDDRPEPAQFTLSCSPLRCADGTIGGFVNIVTETSAAVAARAALFRSEERQRFLLALNDALQPLADPTAIRATTARLLGEYLRADRAMYADVEGRPGMETGAIRGQYARPAPVGEPAVMPFPELFTFANYGAHRMAARYRGDMLVVTDIDADADADAAERGAWAEAGVAAAIVAPLVKNGRLVAEFGVHSTRPRPWTDAEVSLVRDVAERTWAVAERARAEGALQALVEGVPQLVWRAGKSGEWTWASPQWTAFTGQPEPESHGLGWLETLHPDDREAALRFWHTAARTGRLEMDGRIRHAATGRYRWFQTRAAPVRSADGAIIEWLGTSTDVDDLRRLHNRQQVLVAELQHRVRNILMIVRSVFTRTVEAHGPVDEMIEHFRGRLDNLARTQVVVTRSTDRGIDLHALILEELLSVGVANSPGVTLDGPDVALGAVTAESISLAIHELTTNALKYGALKLSGATLDIRWAVEEEQPGSFRLHLTWTERGVPAISVRPVRYGFGTELIEEALPYRLGAETELEFRGGGVRCTIRVPLGEGAAPMQSGGDGQ